MHQLFVVSAAAGADVFQRATHHFLSLCQQGRVGQETDGLIL